ncbi:MAG: SurA N-terminal domain-containing protein, partial [Candidatus Eiseniibacteriota bacterium]
MNVKRRLTAPCLVALVLAVSSGAQGPAGTRAASVPGGSARTVARVGQLTIDFDELERGEREAHKLYRDRNRADIAPELVRAVRRQVLENLIRQRLLALDARQRGETVSDAEVEAQIQLDPAFRQGGLFNEAKYLAIKAANPVGFARAFALTRDALAARKAGERMDRETRPDDAAIRAELERELALVSIDYLALRRGSFDGSYTEPRERDVLEQYAAHAERYRRPASARLAMILFNRPALSDLESATPAGYQAWEQRMRARADSALAAIRAGARLDQLALYDGGMKTVTLVRDRPPDLWRGGPRDVAAVFAAAPGALLPEPVRAAPGWALVRVESVTPSHIAPLRDVSREIRRELRLAAKARSEEALLAAIYASLRDSLRGDGYRVRYALADTGSFSPGEPAAPELDRYYRAHLADYSTYQRETGAIVETPFSQAYVDVRRRWMRERQRELARAAAERLRETWSRGRSDPAVERSLTLVRGVEVVPAAGDADTGRVAAALTTALEAAQGQRGVFVIPVAGGNLILDLQEAVRGVV